MAPTSKITHLTFAVKDFDQTIAFYKKYCDFKVLRDRRKEGGDTIWIGPATFSNDSPSFVFVLTQAQDFNTLDHLGLQCENREDLDEIAQMGKEDGHYYLGPQDLGGSVGSFVMLKDPNGHIIEFTCGQPITGID